MATPNISDFREPGIEVINPWGDELIAQQWATAEFAALCQLHVAGVPVP